MLFILFISALVVVPTVAVVLTHAIVSEKKYREARWPTVDPIGKQRKKVRDLYNYAHRLARPEEGVSAVRADIRRHYHEVAAKKLAQEEEKLEAMLVEADREEFEKLVGE